MKKAQDVITRADLAIKEMDEVIERTENSMKKRIYLKASPLWFDMLSYSTITGAIMYLFTKTHNWFIGIGALLTYWMLLNYVDALIYCLPTKNWFPANIMKNERSRLIMSAVITAIISIMINMFINKTVAEIGKMQCN